MYFSEYSFAVQDSTAGMHAVPAQFSEFAACSTPQTPYSRHASTLTPSLSRWAAARVCFPPTCCKPGIKGIPRDVKLPSYTFLHYRLATVGHRSFPVAASLLWNKLAPDGQSSASLSVFRHRLKTILFS